MAARWNFVPFVLLNFLSCCYCDSFPVPLLIWSSKSLDIDDEILAGHTLHYENIQKDYLDKLSSQPNTICVFIQDKLSIDDFAIHQSTNFKNFKEVLSQSSTSIVLPSVTLHSPLGTDNKLVEYFEQKSQGKFLSLSAKDVSDFPKKIKELKPDGFNIIIIHLSSSQSGENIADRNLAASDDVIERVTKELQKSFPDYIGLLTAEMPRDDIIVGMKENLDKSSLHHMRSRREADTMNADEDRAAPCSIPGLFVNVDGYYMLYFRDINVTKNGTNDVLKGNHTVNGTSENSAHNITLSFDIPSSSFKNNSELTLNFLFDVTGPYWSCADIGLNGKLSNKTSTIDIDDHFDCSSNDAIKKNLNIEMDVPQGRSFACDNYAINGIKGTVLIMKGFQVDPQRTTKEFSNSVNCIGFFTPPIWMGLLTTGVLVAILYGGMLSLLSIRSMDRFDNPNDPTIVIHAE